jgi:hypothetical protein
MTPEDIDLMDRYFPFPAHVALLVKPFAVKTSAAGFFVRQNGAFPENAQLEFPFRRGELAPGTASGVAEEVPRAARIESEPPQLLEEPVNGGIAEIRPPSRRSGLPGWVLIPLSFLFLVLGLLLGYQAALTRSSADADAAFLLQLSVARTGDNLTVHWNRDAPAVRAAQKGLLEIEDGGYTKPVDLDLAHLQGGSLIYRNSSNRVRFRLIVSLNARSNVTETLEWRQ